MKITLLHKLPLEWMMVGGLFVLWAGLLFSSALVEIASLFSLGSIILLKIRERDGPMGIDKSLALPLFIFTGICVLSYIWSEYPPQSLRGIFKVLQQVSIFWMVTQIFRDHQQLKRFETLFLILAVLLVADGFYQYTFGKDLIRGIPIQGSMAGPRVSASLKNYGMFGAHLAMILLFLFMLGLRWRNLDGKWKYWYFCLPTSIGALFLLFLTRSRGAILAFLLGTFFYLIFRKKIILLFLLFTFLVGLAFILPPSMILHLDGYLREQSLVERYCLWDRAVQVIKAKPLTGTGINTYSVAHPKYDKKQNWRVKNYYAHNGFLQMAAETGLPSLFAFLWFLFRYFQRGFGALKRWPHPREQDILLSLLIGVLNFLLLAGIDTVLHNSQAALTFWYLLGLGLVYQEEYSKNIFKKSDVEASLCLK